MTNDEAKKVAEIMSTADGGCHYCAAELFRQFSAAFPGFENAIEEVWMDDGNSEGSWRTE